MGQQISVEEAFPTFQKRCTELFEENLVLRAQVDVLERQLAAAREGDAPMQDSPQQPTPAGGDLTGQPPYPEEEQG